MTKNLNTETGETVLRTSGRKVYNEDGVRERRSTDPEVRVHTIWKMDSRNIEFVKM